MATTPINHIITSNNKAVTAIDKYLSNQPSIVLAAKAYTPAELTAALQTQSANLVAAEEARLRHRRLVAANRAARKADEALRLALKSYVTLQFGAAAVDVLGEFGFTPKAKQPRSVATTVQAIEKAKATRIARHTMGKKQRLAIKAPPLPAPVAQSRDGK